MKLFTQEVKDMKELNEVLKDNNMISKDYEVAVIVYAFDKDNKIIFHISIFRILSNNLLSNCNM